MVWNCKNSNCTENDIYNLVHDTATGDIICTSCGVVQDLSIHDVFSLGRSGGKHAVSRSVVPGFEFKDTYVRFVHFMERFAAHDRAEPVVPEDDMDIIRAFHQKFMQKNFFYRERAKSGLLDKRDIQGLLRFIDGNKKTKSWRGTSKLEKPPTVEMKKKKTNSTAFSRLYLERWNSIITDLTGVENEQYDPIEMARILHFMEMFSDLWDTWQDPKYQFDPEKKNWRYKHRKHFPNINFMFRNVHRMLTLTRYNKDYPLPTTENAISNLKIYWKDMCNELVKRKKLDPSWLTAADLPEKYKQSTLDGFIASRNKPKDNQDSNANCIEGAC